MDNNQGRYSMSTLHHKYRVWLDRGIALGELLQRLSTLRIFGQLRHLTTAGLTGRVSTSQASDTGLSRKDTGSIDKQLSSYTYLLLASDSFHVRNTTLPSDSFHIGQGSAYTRMRTPFIPPIFCSRVLAVSLSLSLLTAMLIPSPVEAKPELITPGQLTPKQKVLDEELSKAKSIDQVLEEQIQLPGQTYETFARLPQQKNVSRVRYRVNSLGQAVFEGDMILGSATAVRQWGLDYARLVKAAKNGGPQPSVAVDDAQYRWPGGVVPYKISGSFKNKTINAIQDAVDQLNAATNVRFIPYVKKAHKDYVDIILMKEKSAGGGQAELGRQGGRQTLRLKSDIDKSSTVIHEFMHSLGFRHEHTRADRDKYVLICEDNIIRSERGNFEIHEGDFEIDAYDKDSIMHYSGFAFNRSCNLVALTAGQPCGQDTHLPSVCSVCPDLLTYTARDGKCLATIIERTTQDPFEDKDTLSSGDIAAINVLYPEETAGTTLPLGNQLRTLRVTVQRLITRAGPNEHGVCGKKTDYVLKMKAGPVYSVAGIFENQFDEDRTSSWETDKPERSDDFRPNWRLSAPVEANADLMRADFYVYDHDDALCGGKDDVIDVNPTAFAFLRLLVNTVNGDWYHLKYETHEVSQVQSYPVNSSRGGNIFDANTATYKTLTFNGLKDGEVDYKDEAEIQIMIEVLEL